MRGSRALLLGLTIGAIIGIGIVGFLSCQSTTTSPFSGKPVTREVLAAEAQAAEATRRAEAAEKVAAEQARKDDATREARAAQDKLQRTTAAQVADADAAHAARVRSIRLTTENALTDIMMTVEAVHGHADAAVAQEQASLRADLARLASSYEASTRELDRKDALRSALTGGVLEVGNQVVPIAAAAAGPAGGVVTSLWSVVAGVLAGGGVAGTAGVLAKKKADAKAADAEARAAETRAQAGEAFNAIEVAKAAIPELADAWKKAKPLIKEWSGEDATKLVHNLKEFGTAA